MINNEFLTQISVMSKEDLITLWETTQKPINDYKDWIAYLTALPDKTHFNEYIVYSARRVVIDVLTKHNADFSGDSTKIYFDEIRKATKEEIWYLPDFKEYFGCKTKKEMNEVDLSIYKFD